MPLSVYICTRCRTALTSPDEVHPCVLAQPKLGMKIEGTGGILIAYTHKHSGGNGMYPNGIGICLLPHNDFHPYVVWNIVTANEGQTWFAETGSYCSTLGHAIETYMRRGGKDEL